jgi:hypothetical protein
MMVLNPPMAEPITSIPSSATNGRTDEPANFIPPYCTIAFSSHIPPMGTGIP